MRGVRSARFSSIARVGSSVSSAACIERMNEADVAAAAVMTLTDLPGLNPRALDLIAGACSEYAGRLYGFIRLNPRYSKESLELLNYAVTILGFRGLKLHPVSTCAHPAGEESIALVRRAGELGVPTLFHCGDEPLTTPLSIAHAALACPGSIIILGHMGGYFHVDEAIDVAEMHANIVLETSAMPYPAKIREAVDRVGAERVVFGSDGPVASPVLERHKVEIAGLTAEEKELVLGSNAVKLLRLSNDN